jgi:hypothetical protein
MSNDGEEEQGDDIDESAKYIRIAERFNNAVIFGRAEIAKGLILNSTRSIFNNFHSERDYQGRTLLDENGKAVRSGQRMEGYTTICNTIDQIFPILSSGCKVTPFRYWVFGRFDSTSKGNPWETTLSKNIKVCFTGIQAPIVKPEIFSKAFMEFQYYCLSFDEDSNGVTKISEIQSNDIEISDIDPAVNTEVYQTQGKKERCNVLKNYYRRDGDRLFHSSEFITGHKRDLALDNK